MLRPSRQQVTAQLRLPRSYYWMRGSSQSCSLPARHVHVKAQLAPAREDARGLSSNIIRSAA